MTQSPSPQPVPPAAESTGAEAGVTQPAGGVTPRRPDLTQPFEKRPADPRPATIATQEIRLALAFTGGVSLAVWMGGVARELDLLVQASAMRRRPDEPADPSTPVVGTAKPQQSDQVRRLYRRLLDLVDVDVSIDVLAGTSAGGINAALLGLVNACGYDLGPLRDIWLDAGDFSKLLRDPREKEPTSLLKGDGQMLTALTEGIERLIREGQPRREALGAGPDILPRSTDVFITTTFLSPENSTVSDDYGTQIADSDHHGLFHFDQDDLDDGDAIAAPLALAARSSASFPGAFEPSYVPFGKDGKDGSAHPDMARWSNATTSHWAADGGLLVNRPLAPLLQTVFDRSADRPVRRALLYVVPSSEVPPPAEPDRLGAPLGLAPALLKDLGATLTQSIAADLAAIKEHNDRTGAVLDTRLRLMRLANLLPAGTAFCDAATWRDYRTRQGAWLVSPLITELSRQLSGPGTKPDAWKVAPGLDQDLVLRQAAADAAMPAWLGDLSQMPTDGVAAAVTLGRPAFDSAKATVLRLLRLGMKAVPPEKRDQLARLGMRATRPMSGTRTADLRPLVAGFLAEERTATPPKSCAQLARALTAAYLQQQPTELELRSAWGELVDVCGQTLDAVTPFLSTAGGSAVEDELAQYVQYLRGGDTARKLLELHVAVRSVLPVLVEVEQRVELVQVSADTRTLLAPGIDTAAEKLTGMQLQHFGAFYKTSWRANDWMWGRLDGCGWLVHVLLDPRRMIAVLEDDEIPLAERPAEFAKRLEKAIERDLPAKQRAALAFLAVDGQPPPSSLPELATWVAEAIQQHVVAEELPEVATWVAAPRDGRPSAAARAWVKSVGTTDWTSRDEAAERLTACPVPRETLEKEAAGRTPLFVRTVTQVAAVTTSAATSMKEPPASVRPTFATARTATRTAYVIANKTEGVRLRVAIAALVCLVLGVVATLTHIAVLGIGGVVLFTVGAILLGITVGRGFLDFWRIVLALAFVFVAAAPWLWWPGKKIFSWLSKTAFPWLGNTFVDTVQNFPWLWPIIVFLVVLPLVTVAADFFRRVFRRPTGRRQPPSSPADALPPLPTPRPPVEQPPVSSPEPEPAGPGG